MIMSLIFTIIAISLIIWGLFAIGFDIIEMCPIILFLILDAFSLFEKAYGNIFVFTLIIVWMICLHFAFNL